MTDRTCKVDGCDTPEGVGRKKYQMCEKHFTRLRRTGTTTDPMIATCVTCHGAFTRPGKRGPIPKHCSPECAPECVVDGCVRKQTRKKWCGRHYNRWWDHGDAARTPTHIVSEERLCVVCGAIPDADSSMRKFCSVLCHGDYYRYGAKGRPTQTNCGVCDTVIDLTAPDKRGRRQSTQTLVCKNCRRDPRAYELSAVQLAERDGANCALCLDPVDFGLKSPDDFSPSVDHIIPWSRGGRNDAANLQLAHRICNVRKGVGT